MCLALLQQGEEAGLGVRGSHPMPTARGRPPKRGRPASVTSGSPCGITHKGSLTDLYRSSMSSGSTPASSQREKWLWYFSGASSYNTVYHTGHACQPTRLHKPCVEGTEMHPGS